MFNPAKASEAIKEEFVDYISTVHRFADKNLQRQFVTLLRENVAKGPILEMNDVFEKGKSIKELIDDGVLSPLFMDLEKEKIAKGYKQFLPVDRSLYKHQENAIRKIVAGNNAVVSTGTGSGKTNCFLIPVINELLREKEKGTLCPGVRAMFIYPMNALANDQIKNLRRILMDYPDITFGVYNGGTEKEEEKAESLYKALFGKEEYPELRKPLKNELLSRAEMRENPPHILFTNYAMLEHLLLRPNDDVLFTKQGTNFRFVVLDEAHVYSGAKGIETSLLLSRLRARIHTESKTQFILTSATLGSDEKSNNDIVRFAESLSGSDFSVENIIRSERKLFQADFDGNDYPSEIYRELADEKNIVSVVLDKYGVEHSTSNDEKELIYDFIKNSKLYFLLRFKCDKVTDIHKLTESLGIDRDTAIAFVSLCTRAQKNGDALLDARYHFFVRGLEGCYIALTPQRKLFFNRQKQYRVEDKIYAVFEVAACTSCGEIALVGQIDKEHFFVHANKLSDAVVYLHIDTESNADLMFDDDDTDDVVKESGNETYWLCPHCGAIFDNEDNNNCRCTGNPQYIKVKTVRQTEKKGAWCVNCQDSYRRFYLGNDAATGVLATALYEELPELEYKEEKKIEKKDKGLFGSIFNKQDTKAVSYKAKQFLTFSDSRQEAAKFACYMEKSYQEFLRRRGVCHILNEYIHEGVTSVSVDDFVNRLTRYFSTKNVFANEHGDTDSHINKDKSQAWVAVLNEMVSSKRRTSLCALGLMQFVYKGFYNNGTYQEQIISAICEKFKVNECVAQNLLKMLSFELVNTKALWTGNESDLGNEEREYLFYSSSQIYLKKRKDSNDSKNVKNWLPKQKSKAGPSYYNTNLKLWTMKSLGLTEKDAYDFLVQLFDEFLTNKDCNDKCMDYKDGKYVMSAKNFEILLPGHPDAKWYKCKKCGAISTYNLHNQCSILKCGGEVEEITDLSSLSKDNHYAKLYFSDLMSPLFIKEHTAQLSKVDATEYQEKFITKKINALSCSTTFEMGVDVGDLETVFLRNVPPQPSNYAQRAGRAGRSVNAAAYALTYAKLSSHDMAFFSEPNRMIKGVIFPPLFKGDNEKIVRRHIYAVAFSMFFAKNPGQFNKNNADIFLNENGYIEFCNWLMTEPKELREMLKRSIPDIDGNLHESIGINDFGWLDKFWDEDGKDGIFSNLIDEYKGTIEDLETKIEELSKDVKTNSREIDHLSNRLKKYKYNNLIEFLASGNVLPRYGFPIETIELHQSNEASAIQRLKLSRDLQIGIAEYAPSSEVVANGKLYTSRYIKKPVVKNQNFDWEYAYIAKCDNEECGTTNYRDMYPTEDELKCLACGHPIDKSRFHKSILPRAGFIAEKDPKSVPMTKQDKAYRSQDFYIGNKQKANNAKAFETKEYKFKDVEIKLQFSSNDTMLVETIDVFYYCPQCGYAVNQHEGIGSSSNKKMMKEAFAEDVKVTTKHEFPNSTKKCNNQLLKKCSLHTTFDTDVVKIDFSCPTDNKETMLSVMYAILNSVAKILNIERNDIRACLDLRFINGFKHYSIVVYDSVPGGAGHSRRLVQGSRDILEKVFTDALQVLSVCKCDPSCYNCLRSYDNQRVHDLLDRKLAIEFLKQLVD